MAPFYVGLIADVLENLAFSIFKARLSETTVNEPTQTQCHYPRMETRFARTSHEFLNPLLQLNLNFPCFHCCMLDARCKPDL